MHAIANNWRFNGWDFWAELDTGSETGANQLNVFYAASRSRRLHPNPTDDAEFVRSFYFDDANESHMRRFCYKFATDESYRNASLYGAAPWALRDALFDRNLRPHAAMRSWLSNKQPEELFRFLKKHAEAILARDEYKALVAQDGRLHPDDGVAGMDTEIIPAVDAFNDIPHTVTRTSCQGVSGHVLHEGRLLLAVSKHEPDAYVRLETAHAFEAAFRSVSEHFDNIIVDRDSVGLIVMANGDNVAFRSDAVRFAEAVKEAIVTPPHPYGEIERIGKIFKPGA